MDPAESTVEAGAVKSAGGTGSAREFEVCPVDQLPPGGHVIRQAGNRQLGVFNVGGEYYALPNICPHQTGPACQGKYLVGAVRAGEDTDWIPEWIFDGQVMVCPWHGLEYHVPTGKCLAFPNISLRRYHVFVRDDMIMVRL